MTNAPPTHPSRPLTRLAPAHTTRHESILSRREPCEVGRGRARGAATIHHAATNTIDSRRRRRRRRRLPQLVDQVRRNSTVSSATEAMLLEVAQDFVDKAAKAASELGARRCTLHAALRTAQPSCTQCNHPTL